MNKSIKFLLVAVAAISMASCSTGYYLSNSQNVNLSQTQVVLSQANFQVVKQVKVTYVYKNLHSMRFNASQMKESAYAALVKEAKLTGAQTLINVTMEQLELETVNLFHISQKNEQVILVSGTVIEFLPAGVTPTKSEVIESYLCGEPFTNSNDATVSVRDANTGVMANINETKTSTVPVLDSDILQKSSYELLRERYEIKYPSFWEAIKKVRNYFSMCNMHVEMDKVSALLMSNDGKKIGALMQEVAQKQDVSAALLSNVFLKYVE